MVALAVGLAFGQRLGRGQVLLRGVEVARLQIEFSQRDVQVGARSCGTDSEGIGLRQGLPAQRSRLRRPTRHRPHLGEQRGAVQLIYQGTGRVVAIASVKVVIAARTSPSDHAARARKPYAAPRQK